MRQRRGLRAPMAGEPTARARGIPPTTPLYRPDPPLVLGAPMACGGGSGPATLGKSVAGGGSTHHAAVELVVNVPPSLGRRVLHPPRAAVRRVAVLIVLVAIVVGTHHCTLAEGRLHTQLVVCAAEALLPLDLLEPGEEVLEVDIAGEEELGWRPRELCHHSLREADHGLHHGGSPCVRWAAAQGRAEQQKSLHAWLAFVCCDPTPHPCRPT